MRAPTLMNTKGLCTTHLAVSASFHHHLPNGKHVDMLYLYLPIYPREPCVGCGVQMFRHPLADSILFQPLLRRSDLTPTNRSKASPVSQTPSGKTHTTSLNKSSVAPKVSALASRRSTTETPTSIAQLGKQASIEAPNIAITLKKRPSISRNATPIKRTSPSATAFKVCGIGMLVDGYSVRGHLLTSTLGC